MRQTVDPYSVFQPQPEAVPPPPTLDYLIGVDLAEAADYTAIALIERTVTATVAVYRLRHLERFQDRPYTDVARHLRGIVEALRTAEKRREVTVLYDKTGVGAGVGHILAESDIDGQVIGVWIHGGDQVSGDERDGFRVPKKDLVGAVAIAMQEKRLRIRPTMTLAPVLVDELGYFRSKINIVTGHEKFEAWRERQHDDTVLAVALAVWYGERPKEASWDDLDSNAIAGWQAFATGRI